MYISIEEGTKFFDSVTLILNSLSVEKLLAVIHPSLLRNWAVYSHLFFWLQKMNTSWDGGTSLIQALAAWKGKLLW